MKYENRNTKTVWNPDLDYKDEYCNVYFRIDSDYKWGSGWSDSDVSNAFHNEVNEIFESLGWVIKPSEFSGACDEAWNDKERLYLHPMEFNGEVKKNHIKRIAEVLEQKARNFKLTFVDIYEDVFDITDEEYRERLQEKSAEIESSILTFCKTKRSNLFKYRCDTEELVSKKYQITTLGLKNTYTTDKVIQSFIKETIDKLIDKGLLIKGYKGSLELIRTANKKEMKEVK